MSSREEFEAWFYASKYAQVAPPTKAAEQAAWDGWQASRAALVVELPKVIIDDDMNKAEWEAARDMRERCEEAIQAAGIPVKQP